MQKAFSCLQHYILKRQKKYVLYKSIICRKVNATKQIGKAFLQKKSRIAPTKANAIHTSISF